MASVAFIAGRVEHLGETFPALQEAAERAHVTVHPVAWTEEAAAWFEMREVLHSVNIPGTLSDNVRMYLSAFGDDDVVGRVDDDILVAPDTLSLLMDALGEHDTVSAWSFPTRPMRGAWRGRVVFGACHLARGSAIDEGYATFYPTWAAGVDAIWADAGATSLGPTTRTEPYLVTALQEVTPEQPAIAPLDYGDVIVWLPTNNLKGEIDTSFTRFQRRGTR